MIYILFDPKKKDLAIGEILGHHMYSPYQTQAIQVYVKANLLKLHCYLSLHSLAQGNQPELSKN